MVLIVTTDNRMEKMSNKRDRDTDDTGRCSNTSNDRNVLFLFSSVFAFHVILAYLEHGLFFVWTFTCFTLSVCSSTTGMF